MRIVSTIHLEVPLYYGTRGDRASRTVYVIRQIQHGRMDVDINVFIQRLVNVRVGTIRELQEVGAKSSSYTVVSENG